MSRVGATQPATGPNIVDADSNNLGKRGKPTAGGWLGEPEAHLSPNLISLVALGQAFFYIVTGLWPIVSSHTFQVITGPKETFWLVKTVGILIVVIGAVLAVAGVRRRISLEIMLLAVGSALSLTAVDLIYVAQRKIPPVYLLDAVAEMIIVALWIAAWMHQQRSHQQQVLAAAQSDYRSHQSQNSQDQGEDQQHGRN